jgi:chromosome segregation protein
VYLKSLKLVGFKSFADRTRLEFRSGVTVIVGPNGSGKSNLVDALSWVLGTQSPKTLRTGKMEDVVFAGTATRPALNRAEAVLVIDNAERKLPLDLDEVAIARRLYRDGSSDYEINGVNCRLLDIQELLSDSGVGRHQHVIIGQGQIDSVLNASPEDHRAVIEEAAGILKHRRRKEKAERRLERTDEDVLRLQDLLGEIERQLRPLRRQARAAASYDGLRNEVRTLRLYLSGAALRDIDDQMVQATGEHATLRDDVARGDNDVIVVGEQVADLSARAATLGGEVERDTAAAALLETTAERLRRIASVAHERSRAVTGRHHATVQRKADLEAELTAIRDELDNLEPGAADASLEAESREVRFRRLEDEERVITTQNALSAEGAVAAVRGELSVLEAAGIRDERELEAISHRLDVVDGQLRAESNEISGLNEEVRSIDEKVVKLQAVFDQASRHRSTDQEAWGKAEEGLIDARLAVAAAGARVEAVTAALSGRYDREARRSVEGSAGSRGSLISLLDVPAGLEPAVDAALGRWADAVAFDGLESLQSAVETVKAAGGGGVPVVAPAHADSTPARSVAAGAGVEALVDRMGPRSDRALANHLMGDVLLVEGWTAAWTIISRHPELRAVTPEGDLVSSNGVQIASPDGAGPAMLESAEVDLETAETNLSRAVSIHTAAKRDFEKSRDHERLALEELESAETGLSGRTEAMARLQKSVDVLDGERSRLAQRRSSIVEGVSDRDRQVAELQRRLQSLEGEEAERIRVWEELEARRAQIAVDKESARSEWQESATALQSIVERRRLLEERLTRIESDMDVVEGGPSSTANAATLDRIEAYARRGVDVLQVRLNEVRERQAGLRASHAATVSDLEQARAHHETLRDDIGASRERLGELQVLLTELRLRREGVVEGIRRDADADVELALEAERPDLPEDADLEGLLDERMAQLRRLGPINPLAAVEFAELDERHTFLTDQLADVESSRAELRKVIRALDEEIELRFQAAFQEVAEAYQRYFTVLFPGGRGRIRLTDAGDPESGIMIEAQPLGKKVSQLTLLSGGERSLAALAFLFSVFEARPSPFYVLDEVEAALDDANLRRFLRIVDEFRQRAQLLIVTHQQQTMEAADVLYGVTMEPGGSSQAVRKDMTMVGADLFG